MLKKRPEGLSCLDEIEEEPEIPHQTPHFESSAFAGKDVSEMGEFYIFEETPFLGKTLKVLLDCADFRTRTGKD